MDNKKINDNKEESNKIISKKKNYTIFYKDEKGNI